LSFPYTWNLIAGATVGGQQPASSGSKSEGQGGQSQKVEKGKYKKLRPSGWKEKAALLSALIVDENVSEASVLVQEWMSHGPDRHGEIWGDFMERERRRFEMAQRAATERAQLG
jgi:hypothetical protein